MATLKESLILCSLTAFQNPQIPILNGEVVRISEFDAYNKEKKEWETFPISKFNEVSKQKKRYGPIVVCHDSI